MKQSETVNELHSKAMALAERAFIAQRTGHLEKVKQFSKTAYQYERQAALLLLTDYEVEPTRSVLFRSAACLALDGEDYREAEQMIAFALSGNPPLEILEELRDLWLNLLQVKLARPGSLPQIQGRESYSFVPG
jgi:hypothetical protein